MRELLPGIWTWSWFSPPHGYDFNGWFVPSPDGNLCIDPVEPAGLVLDTLTREGLARIVLTNRNHTRSAALIREATGAAVMIHPADAAHARNQGVAVDAALEVGARVGPFTVIGVPGKSPGEVALHWPARRLLVVGDAVVGNPPGRLGLLRDAVMDDPPGLRASVRALSSLDVDVVLVGDGAPILTGGGARLRELAATFERQA